MKRNNVYGALMILALALVVSVPLTQAQARIVASVPFAFSLEQTSMPAGTYEIISQSDKALIVRDLDTGDARLAIESMHVEGSQASGIPHARLVFRKYGDQYFLAQIWDGQSHIGVAFAESKREKELQMASGSASQPELVVIAMK
jgi:hypothetical protein